MTACQCWMQTTGDGLGMLSIVNVHFLFIDNGMGIFNVSNVYFSGNRPGHEHVEYRECAIVG